MLQACTDAGFHPLVASGYREHKTQQMLFDDNIAGLEMQGMSREEAEKLVSDLSPKPIEFP